VGTTLVIPKSAVGVAQLAAETPAKPAGAKTITGKPVATKAAAPKPVSHVVSSGETLSDIADRYDVTMTDLVAWNAISDADAIHPGQKLVVTHSVAAAKATWSSYTVRRGDTLFEIAQRQGCSVDELRSWNGLKKNTIYAGQKLKVKKA
jgi:LysM repeat protein